jgi:large subunit ribosomal protein L18
MIIKKDKNKQRQRRKARVRGKIRGTEARPRLSVFRSEKHIYAQLIDDDKGITLCSSSSMEKGFEGATSDMKAAEKVGKQIAEKAAALGITKVVFDRSGYIYHGRVKSVADGARSAGLEF